MEDIFRRGTFSHIYSPVDPKSVQSSFKVNINCDINATAALKANFFPLVPFFAKNEAVYVTCFNFMNMIHFTMIATNVTNEQLLHEAWKS